MRDGRTATPEINRAFEQWVIAKTNARMRSMSGLMCLIFALALALELLVASEHVTKVSGVFWLALQLGICCACWASMKWLPWAKDYPSAVGAPFFCAVAGTGGYYLALLGGFDGPFFYSSYMIAPLLVALPCFLTARIILSIAPVSSFVAAYLVAQPEFLSYPLIHIPATYIVLGLVVSIALGNWGFVLAREHFTLGALLTRDNTALNNRVGEKTAKVQSLVEQLESTRESERVSLARALHDDMGQLIVGARMGITNLERKFNEDNALPAAEDLRFLAYVVEDLNSSSRTLIRELRERSSELPLHKRLEGFVQSLRERYELDVVLEMNIEAALVPQDANEAVYRTAQEALTNVLKHAQATRVRVGLTIVKPPESQYSQLEVSIEDDGVGFAWKGPRSPANSPSGSGWGLLGMHERLVSLGGGLRIESTMSGTRIVAHLPLCDGPRT